MSKSEKKKKPNVHVKAELPSEKEEVGQYDAPSREEVVKVLQKTYDPELDMDVWALGLIYELDVDSVARSVYIKMTLTSPMCPYGKELTEMIEKYMFEIGFEKVKIDVVFDPPWKPSDELKEMFGLL